MVFDSIVHLAQFLENHHSHNSCTSRCFANNCECRAVKNMSALNVNGLTIEEEDVNHIQYSSFLDYDFY